MQQRGSGRHWCVLFGNNVRVSRKNTEVNGKTTDNVERVKCQNSKLATAITNGGNSEPEHVPLPNYKRKGCNHASNIYLFWYKCRAQHWASPYAKWSRQDDDMGGASQSSWMKRSSTREFNMYNDVHIHDARLPLIRLPRAC